MTDSSNAAYALVGRVLKNDWYVTKAITRPPQGTGGHFSVCYEVQKGEHTAFLKAINFAAFFSIPGIRVVDAIQEQTSAFNYEKAVLDRCRNMRLSKVAAIIDEGEAVIPGYVINTVPYLIFEMAEGDLRSQLLTFSDDLDAAWKLRSLHNIAVGMKQLHSVRISHQDLKPSNVLIYEQGKTSKVGDLGRALCQDIIAPHDDDGNFAGDGTYAPPEIYYGYREKDWVRRMQQIDLYMFGSLVAFYFSGVVLTGLIFDNINPRFHFQRWRGSYEEVKSYLEVAFYNALVLLRKDISNKYTVDLMPLIEDCTNINPEKRGLHYKRRTKLALPFESIASKLDLLARRAELKIHK